MFPYITLGFCDVLIHSVILLVESLLEALTPMMLIMFNGMDSSLIPAEKVSKIVNLLLRYWNTSWRK